jgi:putative membrane protein
MMWGYNGLGYGGFGGFGMGIGMLLFWGLIIAAIFLLVRGFSAKSGSNHPLPREKTALDILGERYARGEIGKAEFEEKRRDLSAV